MKNPYIIQLPEQTQVAIAEDIRTYLKIIGFPKEEIEKAVEVAKCSKLCDLEDTININNYRSE